MATCAVLTLFPSSPDAGQTCCWHEQAQPANHLTHLLHPKRAQGNSPAKDVGVATHGVVCVSPLPCSILQQPLPWRQTGSRSEGEAASTVHGSAVLCSFGHSTDHVWKQDWVSLPTRACCSRQVCVVTCNLPPEALAAWSLSRAGPGASQTAEAATESWLWKELSWPFETHHT